MKGRIIVIIILISTIILLIFTWLFLQYIIEVFDVDRAMTSTNSFVLKTNQLIFDRYNLIIS